MYDTKTMTPFGGPSFEGCSMAVNDTRDPGHGKQLVMLSPGRGPRNSEQKRGLIRMRDVSDHGTKGPSGCLNHGSKTGTKQVSIGRATNPPPPGTNPRGVLSTAWTGEKRCSMSKLHMACSSAARHVRAGGVKTRLDGS